LPPAPLYRVIPLLDYFGFGIEIVRPLAKLLANVVSDRHPQKLPAPLGLVAKNPPLSTPSLPPSRVAPIG
jgi:hypothetical protein